jgi:hypothetical protein
LIDGLRVRAEECYKFTGRQIEGSIQTGESMSAPIEIVLNERQQAALERVARRRKVSLPRVLKSAVEEFIERMEDEEFLELSDREARRKGDREEDAVGLVRAWRRGNYPEEVK